MRNKQFIKNKVHYINKLLLCIVFIPSLISCSYKLAGYGHVKMVSPSCQPLKDIQVNVNNIENDMFLSSGHLTRDVYYTDDQGQFEFDIEEHSNKLIVFLPDAKGEKEGTSTWNWWSATSSNDEILLASNNNNFKTELLKSSKNSPITFVYPYKETICSNSYLLDKYNTLKIASDRKAKIEAIEKARLDAIKVVIPKYKTKAYGIMEMYSVPGDAGYRISKINNYIKKEQQKLYTMFGIIVIASEPAVLKHSSDITYSLTYPKPGLTNPSTGITTQSRSMGYWQKHSGAPFSEKKEFEMSMIFDKPWKIKSGEWLFQIKNKDSILLEQSFTVE